jgi:hypothetical protein
VKTYTYDANGNLTSDGTYTPQLVVHELGHVLQNRQPEIRRTATHFGEVSGSGFGLRIRVATEFWLPEDAVNLLPSAYVRGSYLNSESDFSNEYLADAFVWWVYSSAVGDVSKLL